MSLIASPLRPKEWRSIPKAVDIVQSECDFVREINCWNEKGVREWKDVNAEAKKQCTSVNNGSVYQICAVNH